MLRKFHLVTNQLCLSVPFIPLIFHGYICALFRSSYSSIYHICQNPLPGIVMYIISIGYLRTLSYILMSGIVKKDESVDQRIRYLYECWLMHSSMVILIINVQFKNRYLFIVVGSNSLNSKIKSCFLRYTCSYLICKISDVARKEMRKFW